MAQRAALTRAQPIAREPRQRTNIYFGEARATGFIPSGCKLLDLALGGGWAENRIINIVGDKSTGKTLLCIEVAANYARMHSLGDIFYRESEHAFDESYARALGMPMDRVSFGEDKLATVEDLFEDLETILDKRKRPALYIVDSLDALGNRAENDQNIDTDTYGALKAKLLSQTFRRLTGELSKAKVTLIIVSQTRDKLNRFAFGKKWTRSGGKALDFYASQIIYLSYISLVKRTVDKIVRPVAVVVNANIEKNKMGLPFRNAEFEIQFGYGIDDAKASVKWLTTTDQKWFGKRKPADVLDDIRKGNDELLRELNERVSVRWHEIETSFLPTRSKYV